MKLLTNKVSVLFAVLLFMVSCSKDSDLMFNQPTAIYVEAYIDSTEYTFATSPSEIIKDTIEIPFRIIGTATATDRKILLEPRAGATAKEGYHYIVGPAIIKANEFGAKVPVYVFRRAGLKDSTVTVILDLKENSDFKLGYSDQLDYKITITDILKKPTIWDSAWSPYFGSYSEVKFRFLLLVTGRTNWNSYPYPGDSRFLSQKAKNALLEYNQKNGDLIDEFGNIVTFL